ncbi:hypothetical protein H6G17_18655 [Chroococcidiopsis sp. FACHB-1243]|nr:hypothetical protein [Chroococcidiopsis sp. [FACHB-1243]]MBD2307497.1 hypothetical protein [Chroococcidiopsis sp. [FACHB-1243]]
MLLYYYLDFKATGNICGKINHANTRSPVGQVEMRSPVGRVGMRSLAKE